MSSIRYANPDAIREFARQLQLFAMDTKEGLRRLELALESMGHNDWRDQNQRVYKEQFEVALRAVLQILQEFETEQSARLIRVAQQYDDVQF